MLRCTRPGCGRAGSDLDGCGDRQVLGCPRPVDIDPSKDIVIRCPKCEITRAFPVDAVMKGHTQIVPRCLGDSEICAAMVLPVLAPSKTRK